MHSSGPSPDEKEAFWQCTSIAIGVKKVGGLGKAGAVWIVVEGADPWLVPTAVTSRLVDGVAHASISQPARVTAVQPSLPGQEELAHCGQLSAQCVAVSGRRSQAQLLWHTGVEHLTWQREESKRGGLQEWKKQERGEAMEWWNINEKMYEKSQSSDPILG